MASTAAILEREELSEPCIYLYREGIFWKAYQYSAYRVIRRHANLKLKKKFIKAVSCEVVSLGFPTATLERIFDKKEVEMLSEKLICIRDSVFDRQAYEQWFGAIPLTGQPENDRNRTELNLFKIPEMILKRIKEFRIEESTPMDCMNFLVSVRKELVEYGDI